MKAIIVDLDGTLCDIAHRLHHVRGFNKNWDAFFDGILNDGIVAPILDTINAFRNYGAAVIFCSGRPEKCRPHSVEWLNKHGVEFTALYMRPDDDKRPDHIVKAQLLDGILEDGYEPFLVVDDRQSVVNMWRERGLMCLQCAPSQPHVSTGAVLYMMVGPSGGGKSTWLRSGEAFNIGIRPSMIVSSDEIREWICRDFRDQTRNDDVFEAVHSVVKTRLRHGLPVVVDATNLRRKDRISVAALSEGLCPVHYIVVDRSMDEKRRDAGWRSELPIDLLAKHDQTFRSQINDIMRGDGMPNVTVHDYRTYRKAA